MIVVSSFLGKSLFLILRPYSNIFVIFSKTIYENQVAYKLSIYCCIYLKRAKCSVSEAASTGMQPVRFHKHHGQNIRISDDGMTATRTCSFAHGICFGDRPLNHVSCNFDLREYASILILLVCYNSTNQGHRAELKHSYFEVAYSCIISLLFFTIRVSV